MNKTFGKIICGEFSLLKKLYNEFRLLPVDLDLRKDDNPDFLYKHQKTIERAVEASAPGTFNCKKMQTIRFEPTNRSGWWFKRRDIKSAMPLKVTSRNARTTIAGGVRNIVMDGVDNSNYVRLIEHIIALKTGIDIDSLMICVDSNDPPLFESGSSELISALNKAGRKVTDNRCRFFTVKRTVSGCWNNGSFLVFSPLKKDALPTLNLDCGVNYNNVMSTQRLKYTVNKTNFNIGAQARTDASLKHAILCKTIGKIFPSTRHLGYNSKNILVAGQHRYITKPKLFYNGKSLESVWHRSTLDLLAAVALIKGRFLGKITSYKAGHAQDVEFIKLLYKHNMFEEVELNFNEY